MQRPDRSQVDPNPKIIDELVSQDHQVRVVWTLVQMLDMGPLYARIKAVEGHAGRTPIDPMILVGVWAFATVEGISSARRLAKLCCRDEAYKWLCGGVTVNYHTLSDFRTDHAVWLEDQITSVVATLLQEGLITLNQAGQDGMRVRASAGSSSFKGAAKLDELLDQAQQQWDRLQAEFENESSQASAAERAAQERAARERLERIERAKQEQAKVAAAREKRKKGDGETARASITDPDAHRMKMADGGTRPAYNVQFTTTLDTLVIVGVDVVVNGSDAGLMDPMVEQIQTRHGQTPGNYCADGGFSSNEDIEKVSQRGVVVFTPVKSEEKKKARGEDPFAPQKGDTPHVAQWRERMGTEEARAQYKQRTKCEWSNAQCRNRGLWQFTVRGLEKVKSVVLWHVLVHNLQRLVSLGAERAELTAASK